MLREWFRLVQGAVLIPREARVASEGRRPQKGHVWGTRVRLHWNNQARDGPSEQGLGGQPASFTKLPLRPATRKPEEARLLAGNSLSGLLA